MGPGDRPFPPMFVEILSGVVIKGKGYDRGQVVDTTIADGEFLIRLGRAKEAPAPTKKKPSAKAED